MKFCSDTAASSQEKGLIDQSIFSGGLRCSGLVDWKKTRSEYKTFGEKTSRGARRITFEISKKDKSNIFVLSFHVWFSDI